MSENKENNESPILDPKHFWSRLRQFYNTWKNNPKLFGATNNTGSTAVDYILISYGKLNENDDYSKYKAIQTNFIGVEADDTHFMFCANDINTLYILTGTKKATLLNVFGESEPNAGKYKIKILITDKTDNNEKNITTLMSLIKANNRRVGVIGSNIYQSDEYANKTCKALTAAISKQSIELIDITTGISSYLSVKDKAAIENIRIASQHTTNILRKILIPKIETVLDEASTIKHSELADITDDAIRDPTKHKFKNEQNIDYDSVESCYTPIIQSGWSQAFDLKPSAQSNDSNLTIDDGVIIVQLGSKYKEYCSNIGRTYFVNPTKEQSDIYTLLSNIFVTCKQTLRAGVKCSEVYTAALNEIKKSKNTDLLEKFTKNCGFGIGLEFRESFLLLNEKNQRQLQKHMIFNLVLGFEKLTTKVKSADTGTTTEKPYAVLLSDTVLVNETECETLTHAPRDWKEIAYYLGDDAEEEEQKEEYTTGVTTRKEKRTDTAASDEQEEQRRLHQQELARKQREAALKKLVKDQTNDQFDGNTSSKQEKTISYNSITDYPATIKSHNIYVDITAETILFPIGDHMVPFHISTVKNVYKAENAGYTYLSVQFQTPDISNNKHVRTSKIIRELTFRGKMNGTLDKTFFEIKELRKRVQDRIKEYEAIKDIVLQEELIVTKIGLIPILKDIYIRPQISKKKNISGSLSVHQNGFRYVTFDKIKLDIIYKNIKYAYYQPAENTASVILHLELKSPIMLDQKKKTNYVQFYVDVVEASEDIGINRRENIEDEDAERRQRKRHNDRFLHFVKQTEDCISKQATTDKSNIRLEFDIPYTELQFTGVPNKQVVSLYPTVHSLVALDDIPPVVIPLNEIEICSLERIIFGLRDFDLVVVWKDFSREPKRIDNIPIKHLRDIKDWLNSCDILFYESSVPLTWKNIMKNINEDLATFWEEGGFEFLNMDSEEQNALEAADGGEGDDVAVVEEESEFEMDSDMSESESDDDSDDSEVSSADSSDYGESEESEGEDWDELDRKAIASDKQKAENRKLKGNDYDSDDDRPKVKKAPAANKQQQRR